MEAQMGHQDSEKHVDLGSMVCHCRAASANGFGGINRDCNAYLV